MKIMGQLDKGEQYTPIKLAEAIIDFCMVGIFPPESEEERLRNLKELKEVNEYITVFVNNHMRGDKNDE